jgi:hypothetical protein
MVMFHPEIPYAEAQRRGQLQEKILHELDSRRAPSDSALAERLVTQHLQPIVR